MLRRNTRLRKEYLYRKSLEGKERDLYERKRKVKHALDEGKPIPTELVQDHEELLKEIQLDDPQAKPSIDDEYARAAILDPKIFITTSHDPSTRLVQFAKELRHIIPNCQKMNRGKHVVKELVDACRANEVTDLIIVHETRGEPDAMIISHMPYGPTAYFSLSGCVLRHDVHTKVPLPGVYPHLIFHNFTTPLGERLMNILKYIFPVPREDSKRVITFANDNDYISFRHHIYETVAYKKVKLTEIGPRFEMRLYQVKLGTMEMEEADNEYVLRPYLNTAKKRTLL